MRANLLRLHPKSSTLEEINQCGIISNTAGIDSGSHYYLRTQEIKVKASEISIKKVNGRQRESRKRGHASAVFLAASQIRRPRQRWP
jgi:hypothetical protein